MSAAIRLVRALRVFLVIFLSYMWQMSWARLWPGRYDTRTRWKLINRRNARRMFRGFVRLRGVYIKLGQILSVMGTFLPREYTEELEALQDDVPPQSYQKIRKTFVQSFGKQPHEVFAKFEQEPIAAASLGQVHEARNASGERLAVKILYPNVVTIINVDLRVLGWALRVYRNFVPLQQIERVHEQLADMLARETDLANEARCIARMAKNFESDPDVAVPRGLPRVVEQDGDDHDVHGRRQDHQEGRARRHRARPLRRRDQADQGVLQAAVRRPVLPRRSAPRQLLRPARRRRPGPDRRARPRLGDRAARQPRRRHVRHPVGPHDPQGRPRGPRHRHDGVHGRGRRSRAARAHGATLLREAAQHQHHRLRQDRPGGRPAPVRSAT